MTQLLPVLASLLALIFFSSKHNGRCYSVVMLSLLAEFASTANAVTLGAVLSCLAGMLIIEWLYALNKSQDPLESNNQKYASKWRERYPQHCHL